VVFKSIFGKGEENDIEEDFLELEPAAHDGDRSLVTVRIEELEDFKDVEVVQKLVRNGNIVFLKIKSLRDKNLGELKRSVQKLQKGAMAMNGDIVGIDDNFLVICPQGARVFRGEAAAK
jgi:SepF-like predicted cell division protein (DUF552 family)